MRAADLIIAFVALAVAAVVAYATWGLPFMDEFGPGPAFAPLLIAAIIGLFGFIILLRALRSPEPKAASEGGEPSWLFARSGLIAALIVAHAVATPWIGTILGSLLFTFVLLALLLRRPIVPSLFTSAVTGLFVYLVFGRWLGVDLPDGVLELL